MKCFEKDIALTNLQMYSLVTTYVFFFARFGPRIFVTAHPGVIFCPFLQVFDNLLW